MTVQKFRYIVGNEPTGRSKIGRAGPLFTRYATAARRRTNDTANPLRNGVETGARRPR